MWSGCSLHTTYIPPTVLPTGYTDSGHAEEAPFNPQENFRSLSQQMSLAELVGIDMELKYPWIYQYISAIVETETTSWLKEIAVAEATTVARVDDVGFGPLLERRKSKCHFQGEKLTD